MMAVNLNLSEGEKKFDAIKKRRFNDKNNLALSL
jgi:hypothetical protein